LSVKTVTRTKKKYEIIRLERRRRRRRRRK